jgi:hypothetical protein
MEDDLNQDIPWRNQDINVYILNVICRGYIIDSKSLSVRKLDLFYDSEYENSGGCWDIIISVRYNG